MYRRYTGMALYSGPVCHPMPHVKFTDNLSNGVFSSSCVIYVAQFEALMAQTHMARQEAVARGTS